MAFARVHSAQLNGLSATAVAVEIDISRGLFLFQIVGLPDKAVEEARERVISALRNSIGKNPKTENNKVIVSLSPADLKKEGGYFDLASGEISFDPEKILFVGELGLNGEVRSIKGFLSIAKWAKENGYKKIFIPNENSEEAKLIEGLECYLVPTLKDISDYFKGEENNITLCKSVPFLYKDHETMDDFADVKGQAAAKRALLISAADGHNIVLYGPPGTGKTMLAKSFHSIIPSLNNEYSWKLPRYTQVLD